MSTCIECCEYGCASSECTSGGEVCLKHQYQVWRQELLHSCRVGSTKDDLQTLTVELTFWLLQNLPLTAAGGLFMAASRSVIRCLAQTCMFSATLQGHTYMRAMVVLVLPVLSCPGLSV